MTTTRLTPSAGRTATDCASAPDSAWPLERALFALAGTVTLISAACAALLSPWFLLLTVFAGLNQWLYVLVGACPASLILSRFFGLRPAAMTSKAVTR